MKERRDILVVTDNQLNDPMLVAIGKTLRFFFLYKKNRSDPSGIGFRPFFVC